MEIDSNTFLKNLIEPEVWYTPIISALGRLRQEDREFDVILGYIIRPCLITLEKKKEKEKTRI
jgi:hypothetical protein